MSITKTIMNTDMDSLGLVINHEGPDPRKKSLGDLKLALTWGQFNYVLLMHMMNLEAPLMDELPLESDGLVAPGTKVKDEGITTGYILSNLIYAGFTRDNYPSKEINKWVKDTWDVLREASLVSIIENYIENN